MTLPIGRAEWIVLDTSVVRGLIEHESTAIDLTELGSVRGRHPIGVADGAVAETMYWLARARDETLKRVRPALERLSPLLDPEFPFAPGGRGIAEWAGLVPYPPEQDRTSQSRLARMAWRHISQIASREDVNRAMTVRSRGEEIDLVPQSPDPVLKGLENAWVTIDVANIAKGWQEKGQGTFTDEDAEKLVQLQRTMLLSKIGLPSGHPAIKRLDLHILHMTQEMRKAMRPGYAPPNKMKSNPAIDAGLLLYMLLPAVVCTADEKLVRAVRGLGCPDKARVMTPVELLTWLRTGALPC